MRLGCWLLPPRLQIPNSKTIPAAHTAAATAQLSTKLYWTLGCRHTPALSHWSAPRLPRASTNQRTGAVRWRASTEIEECEADRRVYCSSRLESDNVVQYSPQMERQLIHSDECKRLQDCTDCLPPHFLAPEPRTSCKTQNIAETFNFSKLVNYSCRCCRTIGTCTLLCTTVLTKQKQQVSVFSAEADSEPTDTFLVDSDIWGDMTPCL